MLLFIAFGNSENLGGPLEIEGLLNKKVFLYKSVRAIAPLHNLDSSDGPAILEDRSSLGILQPTAVIKRFVRWRIKSFYGDWNDGDPPENI